MPFTAGVFTGPVNSFNDAASGTVIDPDDFNELFTDIETALNGVAIPGNRYAWDGSTSAANPGTGRVRCNHATPASATALYASTTDGWGIDISALYAAMGIGNVITIAQVGAASTRLVFRLSTTPVAGSGFYTLTGTVLASNGTLTDSDRVSVEVSYSTTGTTAVPASAPQGRLTLTTGTAIMTSSVTAATTVYYTPAVGRFVPLYDGTSLTMVDVGGELPQATTDSTKSPAAATTNSNYDVFVWKDGLTYRATRGPAWSTATARGSGAGTTELTTVAGLLVNAYAITNGPAAQRGTYVGSIRTNASSQVDYKFGSAAAGGGYISFGVFNAYNQTLIRTTGSDSTASWTYNNTTVRNSNNNANNSASFLCGLGGSPVQFDFGQRIQSTAAGYGLIYVHLDAAATACARSGTLNGADGYARALYNEDPGLGWHTLQCKENSSGSANFIAGGYGADMQFSLSYLG